MEDGLRGRKQFPSICVCEQYHTMLISYLMLRVMVTLSQYQFVSRQDFTTVGILWYGVLISST